MQQAKTRSLLTQYLQNLDYYCLKYTAVALYVWHFHLIVLHNYTILSHICVKNLIRN